MIILGPWDPSWFYMNVVREQVTLFTIGKVTDSETDLRTWMQHSTDVIEWAVVVLVTLMMQTLYCGRCHYLSDSKPPTHVH